MRCRNYVEQTTFIVLIPVLFSGLKFHSNFDCLNFFSNYLVIISFHIYKRKQSLFGFHIKCYVIRFIITRLVYAKSLDKGLN